MTDEALEERAEKALEDVTRLRSDRDGLAHRVAELERSLEAALATDLRCEHCGETYQTTCGAELQAERDDLIRRLKQAERERDEAQIWADIIADISRDALELRALRAVAEWCKEHTADLGILLYEDRFRVVELRLSGTQTLMWKGRLLVEDSITAIADALGLEWREP